jgi:integrase
MEKDGASVSERHKVGTVLRMALKYACPMGLLSHNPADDVSKPQPTKKDIRPLTPERVPLFLTAAERDPYHALYVLALDSGMRQGELFGLHWPDIDFDGSAVTVTHSLEEIDGKHTLKDVKTKHSRRRIKLTPRTMAASHEHRKRMLAEGRNVKTGPVFVNTDGGWLYKANFRIWSFVKLLKRAELLDKDGKPLHRFHDLRHTTATVLLLAGENVKAVSERPGHASIQITLDTYAHVLPTMQDGATDKMAKILGQPLKVQAESR